jgi:hypothetical protein
MSSPTLVFSFFPSSSLYQSSFLLLLLIFIRTFIMNDQQPVEMPIWDVFNPVVVPGAATYVPTFEELFGADFPVPEYFDPIPANTFAEFNPLSSVPSDASHHPVPPIQFPSYSAEDPLGFLEDENQFPFLFDTLENTLAVPPPSNVGNSVPPTSSYPFTEQDVIQAIMDELFTLPLPEVPSTLFTDLPSFNPNDIPPVEAVDHWFEPSNLVQDSTTSTASDFLSPSTPTIPEFDLSMFPSFHPSQHLVRQRTNSLSWIHPPLPPHLNLDPRFPIERVSYDDGTVPMGVYLPDPREPSVAPSIHEEQVVTPVETEQLRRSERLQNANFESNLKRVREEEPSM